MENFQTIEVEGNLANTEETRRTNPGPGEIQNQEIQKRIQDAFEVFDHEHNNTVDVREIGTIIRSLGLCPSEADLQEVLRDVEDPQQNGYVHIDRFYPIMTKILQEQKYPSADSDILLKAFEVLDRDSKGFLTPEELRQYFTHHGERFGPEETEELLNAALDPATKTIQYRTFLHYLTINEDN